MVMLTLQDAEDILELLGELEATWRWKKDEPRRSKRIEYYEVVSAIAAVRASLAAEVVVALPVVPVSEICEVTA